LLRFGYFAGNGVVVAAGKEEKRGESHFWPPVSGLISRQRVGPRAASGGGA
jgi:hypothetical protein